MKKNRRSIIRKLNKKFYNFQIFSKLINLFLYKNLEIEQYLFFKKIWFNYWIKDLYDIFDR